MKAKSCNALLSMLQICIHRYTKSVLRCIFLILDTCHRDILYFREQKCEDPWLFFEASIGPRAKKLGNTGIDHQRVSLYTVFYWFIY